MPMTAPVVNSLTPAAIQTMYRMESSGDDVFFVPTVQVYRIKRNLCDGGESWSVRFGCSIVLFSPALFSSHYIYSFLLHRSLSPMDIIMLTGSAIML